MLLRRLRACCVEGAGRRLLPREGAPTGGQASSGGWPLFSPAPRPAPASRRLGASASQRRTLGLDANLARASPGLGSRWDTTAPTRPLAVFAAGRPLRRQHRGWRAASWRAPAGLSLATQAPRRRDDGCPAVQIRRRGSQHMSCCSPRRTARVGDVTAQLQVQQGCRREQPHPRSPSAGAIHETVGAAAARFACVARRNLILISSRHRAPVGLITAAMQLPDETSLAPDAPPPRPPACGRASCSGGTRSPALQPAARLLLLLLLPLRKPAAAGAEEGHTHTHTHADGGGGGGAERGERGGGSTYCSRGHSSESQPIRHHFNSGEAASPGLPDRPLCQPRATTA